MSYCGIFCDPQEGSESKGKVCSDLPPQERVSHCCNVQILFSIEKRLLQLCKADEPARKGCCPCRNDPATARQMLSYLWLPTDVAVAERQQKDLPQPQNHPACYEEIRSAGRDSPPQEMAADAAPLHLQQNGPLGSFSDIPMYFDRNISGPRDNFIGNLPDGNWIKNMEKKRFLSLRKNHHTALKDPYILIL